jgi:membrane-bound inhibitor of C-type lysozyme
MNTTTVLVAASLLLSINGSAFAKIRSTELGLAGGKPFSYQCDNGKKVIARYYNLSDNSLSFVKLTLDGKEYTLPQVMSASGVRYTDEHKIEWWTKNGATLDEDVADDKSKLAACAEATVKKAEVVAKPQKEVKVAVAVQAGEKATTESKQEAIKRAKLAVKEVAAKQAKKAEVAAQTKKDANTAKEK